MKNKFRGRSSCRAVLWRRIVFTLALISGMVFMIPLVSRATANAGVSPSGSLIVKCSSRELKESGISLAVDLYKVAEVSMPEDHKAVYIPAPGFEGMNITDDPDTGAWRELAQEAALAVLDPETGKNRTEPDRSGVGLETRTELEPGLYLLVARGGTDDYVTVTGAGDIVTKASFGAETYTFSPVLVSVPSRDAVTGEWQYHVEVSLKAEKEEEFGSLSIVKTLQGSDAGSGPVTFVFDVEAELNGKKVYSNVVSLVFWEVGEARLFIDQIPAGATVTVTEVYSGARCSLVSADTQTAVIGADTVAVASFTNTYDGRSNGGQSITNHFRHEAGGWEADQLQNQSQR